MPDFDFDPDESFELALFRAAEAQIRAGHHFLAVVTAQAAVEAVVELAFTSLFGLNLPRSLETMHKLLPDRSFMDRGTRMLWQELTGDKITDEKDLWKPYIKHIKRRNPAAHGSIFGFPNGDPIGEDDARRSVDAAHAMTSHVLGVMNGVWEGWVGPNQERIAEEDSWRALRLVTPRPATPASTRMARVLTELREGSGLSAEQLADASRLHVGSIARIESGLTEPSLTTLGKLAKALGVTTAELVRRAALDASESQLLTGLPMSRKTTR